MMRYVDEYMPAYLKVFKRGESTGKRVLGL